ncbi:MAG: hypothetical protein J5J00_07525 [Deltaproteobacteria bacterium]|nr:hypothetical protein [Deltaproteobacteria bacterium]
MFDPKHKRSGGAESQGPREGPDSHSPQDPDSIAVDLGRTPQLFRVLRSIGNEMAHDSTSPTHIRTTIDGALSAVRRGLITLEDALDSVGTATSKEEMAAALHSRMQHSHSAQDRENLIEMILRCDNNWEFIAEALSSDKSSKEEWVRAIRNQSKALQSKIITEANFGELQEDGALETIAANLLLAITPEMLCDSLSEKRDELAALYFEKGEEQEALEYATQLLLDIYKQLEDHGYGPGRQELEDLYMKAPAELHSEIIEHISQARPNELWSIVAFKIQHTSNGTEQEDSSRLSALLDMVQLSTDGRFRRDEVSTFLLNYSAKSECPSLLRTAALYELFNPHSFNWFNIGKLRIYLNSELNRAGEEAPLMFGAFLAVAAVWPTAREEFKNLLEKPREISEWGEVCSKLSGQPIHIPMVKRAGDVSFVETKKPLLFHIKRIGFENLLGTSLDPRYSQGLQNLLEAAVSSASAAAIKKYLRAPLRSLAESEPRMRAALAAMTGLQLGEQR